MSYKRQINEWWAIIPLCRYHHRGNGLDKRFNEWVALSRANIEDLVKRMPRADWRQKLIYLSSHYGKLPGPLISLARGGEYIRQISRTRAVSPQRKKLFSRIRANG